MRFRSRKRLLIIFLALIAVYIVIKNIYEFCESEDNFDYAKEKRQIGSYLNRIRNHKKSYPIRNETNVNILIDINSICQVDEPKSERNFILFLINSHYNNHLRRKSMRDTWFKLKDFQLSEYLSERQLDSKANDYQIGKNTRLFLKHVFFVGYDEKLNYSLLRQESRVFNDLIMVNVKDNYFNILEKNLAAFDWVLKMCSNVFYVIKLDDDVFVNVNLLLNHLLTHKELNPKVEHFTYCNLITNAKPIREKKSKWNVNSKAYPFEVYPPYCEGFAYITNINTLKLMKQQSEIIPRLWIDDLYLTGLLLHGLNNIKRFAFYTNEKPISLQNSPDHQIKSYIYKNRTKRTEESSYFSFFNVIFEMFNVDQPVQYFKYVFIIIHLHQSDEMVKYDKYKVVSSFETILIKNTCPRDFSFLTSRFNPIEFSKCFQSNEELNDFHFFKLCQELMQLLFSKKYSSTIHFMIFP